MKNIYGGCFGAFIVREGRYHHESMPATTVTEEDIETTREYFVSVAKQYYPVKDGWYGHYAGLSGLNESQIKDFLDSLN